MTIRGKLSMLTGVVVAALAVISMVFVYTLWSLDRIEKERLILSRLALSASEFTAVVNCLDSDQVDGVRERFDEASKNLEGSFAAAGKIKNIQRSSEDLRESMKIITKLYPLVQQTESDIRAQYDALTRDVKQYFFDTKSNRVIQFYTSEYVRGKYNLTEVYTHLDSFFTAVAGAAGTMQAVSQTISEQEVIIDTEIQSRRNFGTLLAVLLSIVLCVGLALFTRIVSKSIRARVNLIEDSLRPIGEGRLTGKIPEMGNDEIAGIAASLNTLVGNLSALILSTKSKVEQLRNKGTDLSTHMEETSASILHINKRIADNENQLAAQTGAVALTSEASALLTGESSMLGAEIQHQAEVIDQAAASIEELIANIAALSSTTVKVDASAGELLALAETGRERIDSVSGSIQEINKSSDNLLGAAKVINTIAAQTNLLAMNAAIEAAHAGDAGLGFAVVADEIRNLANQSSAQAKLVASDLKSAKAGLQRVAFMSEEAQTSFHGILEQVRGVRELVGGVGVALEEQNSGSSVLLTGIGDLRAITARVTDASSSMHGATANIKESIAKLQETTGLVNGNNAEIILGTGEISDSVTAILHMVEENRDLINTLDRETSKFEVAL